MKLKELLGGVETSEIRVGEDCEVTGLCLDSRGARPGCVFFAVPGSQADGHDFIPAALDAGAAVIVAERDAGVGERLVRVRDVRTALAAMARNFYGCPAESLRMIGVTGTNGKTTVTHIVKGVLESAGYKGGLIGTNYNMIGSRVLGAERTTPDFLTLQALLADMREAGCTHCVMEVSSHALAQRRVEGIQYAEALFTNLTQDHLDYHHDMEEYFGSKARLFGQADAALINIDDVYGRRLLELPGINAVTYSAERDEADIVAKNIRLKPDRVEFEAVTTSDIARIEWSTPGLFSVYNALAAVSVALMEGMALRDIAAAIRNLPPVSGRMEVIPGPEDVTVVVDYAHTPDALKNVLSAARGCHDGRVITLFGCGGDRDRGKRPRMGAVAAELSDIVIVTSDNPRTEKPSRIIDDILEGIPDKRGVLVIEDRTEAIRRALGEARPGDMVLLCGKGHEEYQEIGGRRIPLDERAVVAEYMKMGKLYE